MATKKKAAKAGAPTQAKKVGRPSSFTESAAERICTRLAEGESLRTICLDADMPDKATVLRWLAEREQFRAQYARAREAQADFYAEQVVDISDEEHTTVRHGDGDDTREVEVVFDATAVARNRLRVDARKWYAAKLAPKKYGEKVAVGGADDLPPIHSVHDLSTEALIAIASGKQ